MRRLRAEQRVVLGASGREDLVRHAAELQQAFTALHERVEEVAARLEGRMAEAEHRLDGAIAYRALVRYDAYGELSGHQSASLALLDAAGNGVVLSCITHRETARLYCKQVVGGPGGAPALARGGRGDPAGARRGARHASCWRTEWRGRGTSGRPGRTRTPRWRAPAATGSRCRCPRVGDVVRAVQAGELPLRPRARGELARGRGGGDARRPGLRGARRRDGRRAGPPGHLLPRRPRSRSPRTRSGRSTPTRRRPASARASCASASRRAAVVAAASTADAVRAVAWGDALAGAAPHAAIGSRHAAELYGAVVLAEGIEDDEDNATRFAWIARRDGGPPAQARPARRARRCRAPSPRAAGPAATKTALVFWGAGDRAAGWLVACLDEFASRGISLTRIESRPRRIGLGHYMFFCDLLGDAAEPGGGPRHRGAARALRDRARARLVPGGAAEPARRARLGLRGGGSRLGPRAAPNAARFPRDLGYTALRWAYPQHHWGPCRSPTTGGTDLIPTAPAVGLVAACSS